ncbi:transcription factor btf3, putative [Ichthyophthirius multifiliis]|uniref:Nascent polypeptide-associated complex subunit beta n=1 Tax=Ichthyophthirius multifiliis TaxID=5932 RepID=G0QNC5_ICHMU|nr:transcription factor btf3, putative [Ichthyophthirius multifiliis]EGR33290.1 transcription factor btf3, putative [Ichthyophthirius multifiliis]|eukprot:XP_004037276.1 transcription factor btf3, putative [Ichthyophthirius multifiliis]
MDQEVLEARRKLQEKIGDSRTGGKGTQRRKVKKVQKTAITDDKKLKTVIKKFGVQPFQGIDEVNMFRDDKTIMHFDRPEVLASLQSNTFVVIGKSETKSKFFIYLIFFQYFFILFLAVKELLPDILQHLGPNQLKDLKDILESTLDKNQKAGGEEDDIPQLQENFEEASQKVD